MTARSSTRRAAHAFAAAACAGLIAAQMAVAATQTALCGHVDGTVVVAAHSATCASARSVARSFMRGRRDPDGYACRRIAITVGNGWYARCTRHAAFIQITPE